MNKLTKPEQQIPIRNSRYAGRRLWYARRYFGYSRELVAVELGIEASELKEIELGIRDVGNDIFTKCSNLYGRHADWLSKDAKPDESDLKSMNAIPPWRFAQKDWKEFKIFRYVSDKLSNKPLISKTVRELGAVLSENGCSEEFHQVLNTYSSSLKTGNVDIINAISQIGVFTILRLIGILGAILMKGQHKVLMLSESGVKSELRHAAAIALRMLVATYLEIQRSSFEAHIVALQLLVAELLSSQKSLQELFLKLVSNELGPLLKIVFPDAEISLVGDFNAEEFPRLGLVERIDLLSGGTREQIAVLTWLAFAQHMAKRGREMPVILNDVLVWCDDIRLENVFCTLWSASREIQCIVMTCHEKSFSTLGATELKLKPWPQYE